MEGMQVCGTEKVENHLDIDEAIQEMNSVILHAEGLLDRIQGNLKNAKEQECAPPKCVSLSSVLSESAGSIRAKTAHLHEIINQISDSLF